MAQVSINLAVNKFGYVRESSPSAVVDITSMNAVNVSRNSSGYNTNYLYVGFSGFPSSLANKRIYAVSARFRFKSGSRRPGIKPALSTFDPSTLVWTNRPALPPTFFLQTSGSGGSVSDDGVDNTFTMSRGSGDSSTITDQERSAFAVEFLKTLSAGIFCSSTSTSSISSTVYKTLLDGSPSYITIHYDDTINVQSVITPTGNCPTSGYVNPRENRTFSWTFEKNDIYSCAGAFVQSSAALYWKTASGSTWNQISASGATQSLTVPANTFTAGETIQWYLQGTDTSGTTSTSAVYSFSTVSAAVEITPSEPVNTVEDGTADITFNWSYSTSDGFAPSGVDLEWSEAGESNWSALLSNASWRTSYTAPANTFPAGEIQWRIRGYNIDGSAGSYSYASFVSIAAPEINGLQATAVPYSTITWQAEGQQAFQIEANGKTYGPYFGADKSFTLPEYLPDGTHIIRIKVLGTYGMWSAWNEISVDIENVPGDPVTLSGQAKLDVSLVWETEDESADFFIVRDGKIIGHTTGAFFRDRFTTGSYTYKVINRLLDGNYTESNQISRKVCLKNALIASLAGGNWLEIKFSLKDQSDPEYEESVEVTYDHFGGFEFPSATISEYREINASYSAVFLYTEADKHKIFRSLFGKPVVIKTKDGEVHVGILDSWSRKPTEHYYTAYTFTVRRIDWEDYVDDTH